MTLVVAYPSVMSWINRALAVADRKRITQKALAEAAGVEAARINRWKKGEGEVSLRQAMKIASLLGVSLDWLAADAATAAGAGDAYMDRDADAVLRLVSALGLTAEEAMRRLAAPVAPAAAEGEYFRAVSTRELPYSKGNVADREVLGAPPVLPGGVNKRKG